jgi:hypothetical protein
MTSKKQEAIALIQTFIDQTIGCGLFKKASDVIATQAAIDYLNALGVGKLYESREDALKDNKDNDTKSE